MGDEKVRKILSNFGLTEKETEIYIFLAKHGVIRGGEIIEGLRMHRADVYRILKRLQSKGLVEPTLESPVRFTIVPFETVLESFIKAKHDEAIAIEKTKQDLLGDWKNISKPTNEAAPEKFTVIEGNKKILGKIQQMIRETKHQLSMITSITSLVRADQFGLFDSIQKSALNSKIEYRFLTDVSRQNLNVLRAIMKRTAENGFRFRARNPALGLQLSPKMVIRDGEEILYFISPISNEDTHEQDDACILTNCKALVQSFNTVFEDLWHNAVGMDSKIAEIETDKPSPEKHTTEDAEAAKKKYKETTQSAKEEILMITSSEGLTDFLRNSKQLKEWSEKDVTVKIMAPIMGKNLNAALHLPEGCEVRHVPNTQLRTTVVDGQRLFQFTDAPKGKAKPNQTIDSERTFYTNDPEYVEKTRNMLEGIWKNSYAPSAVTLGAILGDTTPVFSPVLEKPTQEEGRFAGVLRVKCETPKLTEDDVLRKILSAKKYPLGNYDKEGIVNYGSMARAVVHPPADFKLPDLMIWITHLHKQSSFGQEDGLMIYWRPGKADSDKYILAAVITDSVIARKARIALFPYSFAVKNIQIVKKDELQVRIHGNTLFAGWTVPIPLTPSPYVLPPSCILFEGYGDIRTKQNIIKNPEGQTQIWEINDYEAFVTFFHPASKYAGPGTDGEFARDVIVTTLPVPPKGKSNNSE